MHPYSRVKILATVHEARATNTQPTANFQRSAAALPPQRDEKVPLRNRSERHTRIVSYCGQTALDSPSFSFPTPPSVEVGTTVTPLLAVEFRMLTLGFRNRMEWNRIESVAGVGVSSCVVCGTYVFDPSSRLTSCINRSGCASKSSGNMLLTVDSNLSAIDPGTPYHLLGEPACR